MSTINPSNTGSPVLPEQPEIVLRPDPQPFEVKEAFKTLRTNIEFSGEDVRVICVTSALPGDGKSTVSYNLARAFAENGSPTLLIDADLRKSVMRKQICKSGNPGQGLTYFLAGMKPYLETVCRTDLPNLEVIFSGQFPPNPSELLGGKRFQALVEIARSKHSVVIIDTPPIGSVIDAAVVAKACDGVILVLKDKAVSSRLARRCKSQLDVTKAQILGCVLNGVDLSSSHYYGHYYGKYYGHYYGE